MSFYIMIQCPAIDDPNFNHCESIGLLSESGNSVFVLYDILNMCVLRDTGKSSLTALSDNDLSRVHAQGYHTARQWLSRPKKAPGTTPVKCKAKRFINVRPKGKRYNAIANLRDRITKAIQLVADIADDTVRSNLALQLDHCNRLANGLTPEQRHKLQNTRTDTRAYSEKMRQSNMRVALEMVNNITVAATS